jgi:hypothetical protein
MDRQRKERSDKGTHRKLKETKKCPQCLIEKPTSEYYTRAKGQVLRSWCKGCETARRKKDRHKINARDRKRTFERVETWFPWLKEIFGEHPLCQCCGRVLTWRNGNHRKSIDSVVLDHRNGGSEEIKVFYKWMYSASLNEHNKQKVLACDFGVLCRRCNSLLPTKDRLKWLKQVITYIEDHQRWK